LTTLALLVAGGLAGGAAVYALDPRDDDETGPRPAPRVQTLHDGDVVVRPEAGARCEASAEGGVRNLYCTRLGGGRFSLVLYDDTVLVYGPLGDPTDPDLSLRWKPERPVKQCGSISVPRRRLRVDIAGGEPRMPCATVRAVMLRFVRSARAGLRARDVRHGGRLWSCYRSRPDGVGWDFHCLGQDDRTGRYVDIGAGRRF
jgi:hypothetical protein